MASVEEEREGSIGSLEGTDTTASMMHDEATLRKPPTETTVLSTHDDEATLKPSKPDEESLLESGPIFTPRVSQQRYTFVRDLIRECKSKKVQYKFQLQFYNYCDKIRRFLWQYNIREYL